MVMAESERASGLATSGLDPATSPASRLQWLKQRREALQEKLARKNNELKNLCIDEAELTGVLPPEIPLDPGESPPIFRKRVGTSFTYPQNLINKLKTNQVEESALELERQVQAGIAAAAFAIMNDVSEGKAVRRKHRLIYQQSQKRLKDLEIRLSFIRQGYSHLSRTSAPVAADSWTLPPGDDDQDLDALAKHHKTKKPRPPLESTDQENTLEKKWQETEIGVLVAPQVNDWHRTRSRYIKPEWHSGTLPAMNTVDHNENLDAYYPDPRTRTYSHGKWEESPGVALRADKNFLGLKTTQVDERPRKTDPYALDAETRQKELWNQKKLEHKYSSMYRHHSACEPQYKGHPQFKSKSQQSFYQDQVPRDKSSPVGVQSLPQYRYPPRPNTSNHTSHSNPNQGSPLNHPNHNAIPHMEHQRHQEDYHRHAETSRKPRGRKSSENSTWCVEESVWYPALDNYLPKDNFGSLDRRKHIMREVVPREHHQHRLEQHPPPPPPPLPPPPHARMLLRTQSLGSVEAWQSGPSGAPPNERYREDKQERQEKEIEWYETSMDLGYTQQIPAARHYPRSSPSPSSVSSSPKLVISPSPGANHPPMFNDTTMKIIQGPEKDLEIPAETSNHTVKYQPYREVTKPFEMSDFYKYSTKFRKKNEGNQRVEQGFNGGKIGNNNSASFINNNNNNNNSNNNNNVNGEEQLGNVPYNGTRRYEHMMPRTIPRKNEGNRDWINPEDCRVPSKDSTVV